MKQRLLILIACLLTITSAQADYLTMKVDRSKKLALVPGSDYSDRSTDKLMAVWQVDNGNVSLSEMGLSGTSPTCWIKAQAAGTSIVKCTWKQLVWDISSLSYKESSVRTRTWYITIVEGTGGEDDEEEEQEDMTVSFVHPELHLWITADKLSGEATIANSALDPSAVDGNSIIYVYDENFVWDHINHWKNLVIPDTIRYAGYTYIITAIGTKAFNRATEVQTISLPESVRSIGDMAFNWCVNLKSITMSDSVRYIGSNAFNLCRELESIKLPKNLEAIGYGAFFECTNLKSINIPENCKSIGNDAFTWCRRLSKLIIEDSDEPLQLGYSYEIAFDYDADFYGGKPYYRGQFADCGIDTLYLGRNIILAETPNGTTTSPYGREHANHFYGIYSSYHIKEGNDYLYLAGIGEKVTDIRGLQSPLCNDEIVLPPNLQSIGNGSLNLSVSPQQEITLPETVTEIGTGTLGGIRIVKVTSSIPAKAGEKPLFDNAVVYVPSGTGKVYREAWGGRIVDSDDPVVTINVRTPGSLYSRLLAQDLQLEDVFRLKLKGIPNDEDWNIVDNMANLYDWDLSELNVTEIPKTLFQDNRLLSSIKLPKQLTSISDSSFVGCTYLSGTIMCPATCVTIGHHAFQNTAISGMTFSNTVNIDKEAFKDCYNFESVRIPSGSVVGEGAFIGSGLKEAIIEDGVKSIISFECEKIKFEGLVDSLKSITALEMYAPDILTWLKLPTPSAPHLFINGEPVSDIIIPSEIADIKYGAFTDCVTLTSVKLPNGLKSIGDNAFSGCTNLQSVVLPSSIKTIGSSAFSACKSLQEVNLPSKLIKIESSTFSDCTGLKSIYFSPTLEVIDNQAFTGCTNLKNLKFPSSLLRIGAHSFSDCSNLVEVNIPESVSTIESGAFRRCPNINTIVAHWNDPITITEDVFPEVPSDCFLYIPIGTSTKYFNAGWNFLPKIKEAGIMDISLNIGGRVSYGEEIIENETKEFFFTPYKSFTLSFNPSDGYSLRKVYLNGKNITSEIEDNEFFVEEPEENMIVKVVFANNDIVTGDVNGDGTVNVTDAVCVVNHILKKTPTVFYDYAADANADDVINVTDAISIIHHVLRNHPLQVKKALNELDPQ